MIILYAKSCVTCQKYKNVTKLENSCRNRGIAFQQRLTPLFDMWAKEAERLENTFRVKQPFVYNIETKKAIQVDLDDIDLESIFE